MYSGEFFTGSRDPYWLERPETQENFDSYQACVRTNNGRSRFYTGDLDGKLTGNIYRPIPFNHEYDSIPSSVVDIGVADRKYVTRGSFQPWTFANPLPTEGHYLFITIPHTMLVYYIELVARDPTKTDREIKRRTNKALKENNFYGQTSSPRLKRVSRSYNRNSG